MPSHTPPAPEFGAPCPVQASPDTLRLMASRRSTAAQVLGQPGPTDEQIDDLIRLAARAPDHGKLKPWRFVVIGGDAKAWLVAELRTLALSQPAPAKAEAALMKLSRPPVSIMVVSRPKPDAMPLWEQELSAGAVCMNMLLAAEAMGLGANWITDWYAYDAQARDLLGVGEGERVAGVIHLGASAEPPQERERPRLEDIVSRLQGGPQSLA